MNHFTVEDFDEFDFKDPISLLSALQKLSAESSTTENDSSNKLLSVDDLIRDYGLSMDTIRHSLLTGSLTPASILLYFSKEDAERLASECSIENPVVTAFENELQKMSMRYSYKPLLLLSLINTTSYTASLDEIVDYFFSYYQERSNAGLKVEKDDSAFVQNEGNRIIAKRTILRYPVAVLIKKGFIIYEKELDSVRINEVLNVYFANNKEHIISRCAELLEKYYDVINIQ